MYAWYIKNYESLYIKVVIKKEYTEKEFQLFEMLYQLEKISKNFRLQENKVKIKE